MLYIEIMGGLGNQMFIYAFARAYQLRYGEQITFIDNKRRLTEHDHCQLSDLSITSRGITFQEGEKGIRGRQGLSYCVFRFFRKFIHIASHGDIQRQNSLEAKLQPIMNAFGACYLTTCQYLHIAHPLFHMPLVAFGYFQSEMFFKTYSDLIRRELRVSGEPNPENLLMLEWIEKTESVCLHVRRGDYTLASNSVYQVCTVDYYRSAIEKMLGYFAHAHFFAFSDDIDWVKQMIPIPNHQVTYIERRNTAPEELRLMYSCKHFIISNSSFSWWAQYLGEYRDKVVIAPDRWYNDRRKVDIWMDGWVHIDSV